MQKFSILKNINVVNKEKNADGFFCVQEGTKSVFEIEENKINKAKKISLPTTIKKIHQASFAKKINLEEVLISEGTVSIGEDAFNSCVSLKRITIPNSVTQIGKVLSKIAIG